MPLYDYDCAACGHRFEVMHGVHADGPAACPMCGSDRVRKAFAAPAVHFKGSGWAKKERRATASPGTSKAAGTDRAGGSDGGGDGSTAASDGGSAKGKDGGDSSGGSEGGKSSSTSTSTTAAASAAGSD